MRRGGLVLVTIAVGVPPAAVATATVPPGGGGESGVQVARELAEEAAADYFAQAIGDGVSHIACEAPSADSPGVTFLCFGVDAAGTPVVAQATLNDYGSAEFAALSDGGPPATTAASGGTTEAPTTAPGGRSTAASTATATTAATTTTSPVIETFEGTGSEVVQIDPITGPTIVSVAHHGAGTFSVQPQQGGVPAGPALMSVTGAWTGRYLVGLGRAVSGFAVTADGDWTVSLERRTGAVALSPSSGVTGENPDVIAYGQDAPWTAAVSYEGPGPIVVRAVTVSGAQDLLNQAGAFSGDIPVPAGPGFLTIDAPGPWSLRPASADEPSTT